MLSALNEGKRLEGGWYRFNDLLNKPVSIEGLIV
jgi:hypothetical protein